MVDVNDTDGSYGAELGECVSDGKMGGVQM